MGTGAPITRPLHLSPGRLPRNASGDGRRFADDIESLRSGAPAWDGPDSDRVEAEQAIPRIDRSKRRGRPSPRARGSATPRTQWRAAHPPIPTTTGDVGTFSVEGVPIIDVRTDRGPQARQPKVDGASPEPGLTSPPVTITTAPAARQQAPDASPRGDIGPIVESAAPSGTVEVQTAPPAAPPAEAGDPESQVHPSDVHAEVPIATGAPGAAIVAVCVAGVALALAAAWSIRPADATRSGLISVMGMEAFLAPVLVAIAAGLTIGRRPYRTALGVCVAISALVVVEVIPALAIGRVGTPLGWMRTGLIDLADTRAIVTATPLDAGVFSGAVATFGFLRRAIGLTSAQSLVVWLPTLLHLALLVPTAALTRRLDPRRRLIAMLFVIVFGGFGLDALSGTAVAAVIGTGFLSILWLRTSTSRPEPHPIGFGVLSGLALLAMALTSVNVLTIVALILVTLVIARRAPATGTWLAGVATTLMVLGWIERRAFAPTGRYVVSGGLSSRVETVLTTIDRAVDQQRVGWGGLGWTHPAIALLDVLCVGAIIVLLARRFRHLSTSQRIIVLGATLGGAVLGGEGPAIARLCLISAPLLAVLVVVPRPNPTDSTPLADLDVDSAEKSSPETTAARTERIGESYADSQPASGTPGEATFKRASARDKAALATTLVAAFAMIAVTALRYSTISYTSLRSTDISAVAWIADAAPNEAIVVTTAASAPWNPADEPFRVLALNADADPVDQLHTLAVNNPDKPIYVLVPIAGERYAEVIATSSESIGANQQLVQRLTTGGEFAIAYELSGSYVLVAGTPR